MKIHFIGIGGIGVSALAKFYLEEGFFVSGSDVAESVIVSELRGQGVKIPPCLPLLKEGEYKVGLKKGEEMRHRKENLSADTDLVVYSAAVPQDNPELTEARRHGIKCQTYAQALGELTKKYFTIAVSGTHGKSTTTAMVALILVEAGYDPTVIVGTKVKWPIQNPSPARHAKQGVAGGQPPRLAEAMAKLAFKKGGAKVSNFRAGKSKYLVIEADEYAASFLSYWPKMIVLTNIEEDHLDYYGNLENILKSFKKYVGHLPKDGVLVANEEDINISKINPATAGQKSRLQFKIQNYNSKLDIKSLNLKVPGRHNLMDAYAAISAVRALDISDKISVRALNKFTGTWRRMEYKGRVNGAKIYDDYGHHPTEIKATLEGARELLKSSKFPPYGWSPAGRQVPSSKLWCVFQPHQYQRTYQLFDRFVGAFDEADVLILLPIYSVAGREKESIKRKVSSEKLAETIKIQNSKIKMQNDSVKCKIAEIREVIYMSSFDKAAEYLRQNLKSGDIAVVMGAGDVYKLTAALLAEL